MTKNEWEEQLRKEGFEHVFVWSDGPGAVYPDHTHESDTAHVILEGEMTLVSQGQTSVCKAGDRFDVAARTVHSAKMGSTGCRYIVGEK